MNFSLRLIAKAILLLTAIAAIGSLQEHHWFLGWLEATIITSIVTFVAVLVHELAHAGAALWLGGIVGKIVVLPFELRLSPVRLRFVGRAGHGDLGGYVSYRLDRIGARHKHALISAAGPFANLVTGIAAGFVAPMFDSGSRGPQFAMVSTTGGLTLPTEEAARAFAASARMAVSHGAPIGSVVAASFMLISVGLGLANLIPFDRSDGMRLWRYLRGLNDHI